MEGPFYLEQKVVILDPIMNTSRDMESVNDVEVVSPKNKPAPVRAKRTYCYIRLMSTPAARSIAPPISIHVNTALLYLKNNGRLCLPFPVKC